MLRLPATALLGLTWAFSACSSGGTPAPQSPPEATFEEPPGAQPPPAQTDLDATEEAVADDDTRSAPAVGAPDNAPTPKPSRDIVYRVTGDGLIVEADGVRFTPTAEAVRLPGGAYGVKLRVTAEVTDKRVHSLLSPPHGPLAIAATIHDKNDQKLAHHADTRTPGSQEDELEILSPGSTLTLERSWPSGSVKGPLWWGQKVRLWVGLWGLGVDETSPRPLKKLFKVDMVAGAHPKALISPPSD